MKTRWITAGLMLLLMAACQPAEKKAGKTSMEEKTVKKDASALVYKMFRVEGATAGKTAQLFRSFLEEEGMYYPRFVDFHHAAQVDNIEFDMNPTVLVIFGNPKEMGVLIRENPEVAYDLPFRILIFQNDEGQVWVMYKDFTTFKKQYFLTDPNNLLEKYDRIVEKFKEKLPSYLQPVENKTA